MRRIILGMFAVALLIVAPASRFPSPHPVTAQQDNSAWFAYLLRINTTTQQQALIRVDSAGTTQEFAIAFPKDALSVGFSPDGKWVAYCENSDTATQLVMWDIEAGRPVWSRNFGRTSDCRVSTHGFNQAGDQVVVGMGSDNAHAGDGPHWRMVILNASNGDIVTELNDQMHSVLVMGLDVFGTSVLVPVIKYFGNDQLIFVLETSGITWGDLQAYSWTLGGEFIEVIANWGRYRADFLPTTGEVVWAEYDPDSASEFTRAFNTTVWVANRDGASRVYYQPDTVILDAIFIDDGQSIFARIARPNVEGWQFAIVSRAGEITEQIMDGSVTGFMAAPQGYIRLRLRHPDELSQEITELLEYVRGNDVQVLWSQQSETDRASDFVALIFSLPTPTDPNLAPFPEVTLP